MRRLVLFLVACASGFASTEGVSVTCNGVVSGGVDSASCGDPFATFASAEIDFALPSSSITLNVYVQATPAEDSQASAWFSDDYVLTVFGGTGEGFLQASLDGTDNTLGAGFQAGGSGSLAWSSGQCVEFDNVWPGPPDPYQPGSCDDTLIPFTFGVSQAFTLTLSANGEGQPFDYYGDTYGSVNFGGFGFYDAQGQPLRGITYTWTSGEAPPPAETPEPGTLPLLAGIAVAAMIGRKLCTAAPAIGRR